MAYTIRRMEQADIPALADVLARAFYNDPVVSQMFPKTSNDELGIRRYTKMFSGTLQTPNVVVYCTTDLKACAIWTPPGVKSQLSGMAMCKLMCCSMLPLLGFCSCSTFWGPSCRSISNIGDSEKLLAKMHPDSDEHPHWYLMMLGTHPDSQGKGYAKALQEHMFELLEKNKETSELHPNATTSVYLEAAYKENAEYYIRRGYKYYAVITTDENGKIVEIDPDIVTGSFHNGRPVGFGMWYGPEGSMPEFKLKP